MKENVSEPNSGNERAVLYLQNEKINLIDRKINL